MPVLCKDDVKEALFDSLGRAIAIGRALLSEASFAALVRTRAARSSPSADRASSRAIGAQRTRRGSQPCSPSSGARAVQIWCCAEPAGNRAPLHIRTRHPGHLDALLPRAELDASGARSRRCSSGSRDRAGCIAAMRPTAYAALHAALNSWRL